MKVVKILGGIGNQMFQYAFYRSLISFFPSEEVKVDFSYFNSYPLHNGLELKSVFNINLPQASKNELKLVTRPLYNYRLYQISKRILPTKKTHLFEDPNSTIDYKKLRGNYYLDGYWQNEFYFDTIKDSIKSIYCFKNIEDNKNIDIEKKIKTENSIGIHFRRKDYLKKKEYRDVCDNTYYINAISYIKNIIKNPYFFIFSDDIDWCINNTKDLIGASPVEYVYNSNGNNYIDMQLMSECKCNIIANSSFSWWGGWLNNNSNKIVIYPKKWLLSNAKAIPAKEWVLI